MADAVAKPLRVACPNCGVSFDARKPHRPRSVEEHRRFFGIVAAAFGSWPELHEFQPESREHLRAWLICQSGPQYRTVETFTLPDAPVTIVATMMGIIEALLQREEGFKFARWRGDVISITRPKSLRFDRMKQGEFHELNERVSTIVSDALGVDIETLLDEAKHGQDDSATD